MGDRNWVPFEEQVRVSEGVDGAIAFCQVVQPRRLPIYGESALDVAVKELTYDWSFGQFIFGGHDVYGYLREPKRQSDRMDFFWSIDTQQDPFCTSLLDLAEILMAKWAYAPDEDVEDPDDPVVDEFGDEMDDEDDLDDDDARTAFSEELDMSRSLFTEMVNYFRDRFLRSRLRDRFRLPKAEHIKHACNNDLAPLKEWPDDPGVYFVAADNRIKIGVATSVRKRLKELQTSAPHKLQLIAVRPRAGRAEESAIHRRFAAYRLHGEWFKASPELLQYVAQLRGARNV
jgi:hypothetical protein